VNHDNSSPNVESNRTEQQISVKFILFCCDSMHLESVMKKSAVSSTDSYSLVSKFICSK